MLNWCLRSRVCHRKVVGSILFSIFISTFDSRRAHPQQIYKDIQSRKTLRNLWPTSRSLKKLNKKHKILHWGWGDPMRLHSWKRTGWGAALLKRTRGMQWTWINSVLSLSIQKLVLGFMRWSFALIAVETAVGISSLVLSLPVQERCWEIVEGPVGCHQHVWFLELLLRSYVLA